MRDAAEWGLELFPNTRELSDQGPRTTPSDETFRGVRVTPATLACRPGMPLPSPSSVLLRTQSDERLVPLAAAGHERAFEAIVERYRGALLRAARRYLPEARAEDALQQAYIAAWSALQRGDEVRDLRAWLYRIVHNTALNQLRVSGYDYAELEESSIARG